MSNFKIFSLIVPYLIYVCYSQGKMVQQLVNKDNTTKNVETTNGSMNNPQSFEPKNTTFVSHQLNFFDDNNRQETNHSANSLRRSRLLLVNQAPTFADSLHPIVIYEWDIITYVFPSVLDEDQATWKIDVASNPGDTPLPTWITVVGKTLVMTPTKGTLETDEQQKSYSLHVKLTDSSMLSSDYSMTVILLQSQEVAIARIENIKLMSPASKTFDLNTYITRHEKVAQIDVIYQDNSSVLPKWVSYSTSDHKLKFDSSKTK